MLWDTNVSHPHCAGGALAFDVLLGNSLADKNAGLPDPPPHKAVRIVRYSAILIGGAQPRPGQPEAGASLDNARRKVLWKPF